MQGKLGSPSSSSDRPLLSSITFFTLAISSSSPITLDDQSCYHEIDSRFVACPFCVTDLVSSLRIDTLEL